VLLNVIALTEISEKNSCQVKLLRLAEKSISEMTYFMLIEMLNSISQSADITDSVTM